MIVVFLIYVTPFDIIFILSVPYNIKNIYNRESFVIALHLLVRIHK